MSRSPHPTVVEFAGCASHEPESQTGCRDPRSLLVLRTPNVRGTRGSPGGLVPGRSQHRQGDRRACGARCPVPGLSLQGQVWVQGCSLLPVAPWGAASGNVTHRTPSLTVWASPLLPMSLALPQNVPQGCALPTEPNLPAGPPAPVSPRAAPCYLLTRQSRLGPSNPAALQPKPQHPADGRTQTDSGPPLPPHPRPTPHPLPQTWRLCLVFILTLSQLPPRRVWTGTVRGSPFPAPHPREGRTR